MSNLDLLVALGGLVITVVLLQRGSTIGGAAIAVVGLLWLGRRELRWGVAGLMRRLGQDKD